MRLFRRKKPRLREIGESEAYGRTYGERSADVKIVKLPPKRPRYSMLATGEKLRQAFEDRLASRDPDKEE